MSHRLIRPLRSVREEDESARAALAVTLRLWPTAHAEPELIGATVKALRAAAINLEATYTLRLFAEFEALLRTQYPHSRPGRPVPGNSDGLIRGLGSRYRIPVAERGRVHRVRMFRHSVAHAAAGAELIPFIDALQWLSRYLAFIPDMDVP
jgi:hypothetical protein